MLSMGKKVKENAGSDSEGICISIHLTIEIYSEPHRQSITHIYVPFGLQPNRHYIFGPSNNLVCLLGPKISYASPTPARSIGLATGLMRWNKDHGLQRACKRCP